MISKEFVTAGRAVFTVEQPNGDHHTYRVGFKKGTNGYADTFFTSLLSGPDNTSDYSYIGVLNADTGEVRLTAKSRYTEDTFAVRVLRRVLANIWTGNGVAIETAGWKVHHEGKCCRCGRALTTPESVLRGMGEICYNHGYAT